MCVVIVNVVLAVAAAHRPPTRMTSLPRRDPV
jgi:hypothetical protein